VYFLVRFPICCFLLAWRLHFMHNSSTDTILTDRQPPLLTHRTLFGGCVRVCSVRNGSATHTWLLVDIESRPRQPRLHPCPVGFGNSFQVSESDGKRYRFPGMYWVILCSIRKSAPVYVIFPFKSFRNALCTSNDLNVTCNTHDVSSVNKCL
jgi:hypothetical protein